MNQPHVLGIPAPFKSDWSFRQPQKMIKPHSLQIIRETERPYQSPQSNAITDPKNTNKARAVGGALLAESHIFYVRRIFLLVYCVLCGRFVGIITYFYSLTC